MGMKKLADDLFDPETFHEIGLLTSHANIALAMNGRETPADGVITGFGKIEPDLIVAWPTAEISAMGPEGGTNIVFRKEIADAADPEADRAGPIEEYRQLINPYIAAGGALVDDVIDPRETRPVLVRALEMAATKKVERPWKKHGVMPV